VLQSATTVRQGTRPSLNGLTLDRQAEAGKHGLGQLVKGEVAKKITEGAMGARAAVVVVRAVKARARVVESRCGITWFL
jgi:hypothetical protein